jgi:hypothetical protein
MMGLLPLHPCQEAVLLSIPQVLARIKANVEHALPEATVRSLAADLSRTPFPRSSGYRAEVERIQQEVLDYLTQHSSQLSAKAR